MYNHLRLFHYPKIS